MSGRRQYKKASQSAHTLFKVVDTSLNTSNKSLTIIGLFIARTAKQSFV
jgi:hypothetical protein